MQLVHRFLGVVLAATCVTVAGAADWPAFRGTRGGSADDKDLPVTLSKDSFLWKVKVPGVGTSSPIICSDKLFLTCYSGYGTKISKGGFGGGGKGGPDTGGDQKQLRLHVLCYDRTNGKLLWQKDLQPNLPEEPFSGFLREHGYASSTPATDGERVYAFFGKTGVFAFDLDGKQLWQADVGAGTNKWGSASSPVLWKDLVIINAAIESKSLIALNKSTGKEAWRVRGMGTCWASPILATTKEGKDELVLNLPEKIYGYEPATGKELWRCTGISGGRGGAVGGGGGGGGGGYTCSTPVSRDGVVYAIGGGGPRPAVSLAVRTGGRGDVTSSHVVWRQKLGANSCSPVLSGEHLCWVNGSAVALKVADGETAYNERLYGARQEYVSAVAAGERIYALTRSDGLFVLAGGGKFEKLGHYDFEEDSSIFNASPAISDGRLYLRSNAYLYCLGNKAQK